MLKLIFEISDITGVGCFNPQPDLDSFFNDINNGFDDLSDSAEECYYLCIHNPECEFFAWNSPSSPGKYLHCFAVKDFEIFYVTPTFSDNDIHNTCWLKRVFNGKNYSPGAVSGFVTDDCRGK